jgi:hypothetical protein
MTADEDAAGDEAAPALDAPGEAADEDAGAEDEEEDELDEQPATARPDRATAPARPASRRIRVRRGVLFMTPSLRSGCILRVSRS